MESLMVEALERIQKEIKELNKKIDTISKKVNTLECEVKDNFEALVTLIEVNKDDIDKVKTGTSKLENNI